MTHSELLKLVEAHERAELEVKESSLAVWAVFMKVEPDLAAEILHLFSTVSAAAFWTSSGSQELSGSPAREAAEGRATEIMTRVRKGDNGFVG